MDSTIRSENSNRGARQSTGPRTAAGKRRSRMNAVKHGLLSRNLILEGENRAEFENLHCALINDLRPHGTLQNLLVERLAIFFWRLRRVLAAETAIISRSPAFVGMTGRPNLDLPDQYLLRGRLTDEVSLLCPKVELIRKAMMGLQQLSEDIKKREGLDYLVGVAALAEIYGNLADCPNESFPPKFIELLMEYEIRSDVKSSSRTAVDFLSRAQCMIMEESFRLTQLYYDERSRSVSNNSFASLVPGHDGLDRILRHETHVSREIERTLNELRRLQRESLEHASCGGSADPQP
jgi:hypothetical protein